MRTKPPISPAKRASLLGLSINSGSWKSDRQNSFCSSINRRTTLKSSRPLRLSIASLKVIFFFLQGLLGGPCQPWFSRPSFSSIGSCSFRIWSSGSCSRLVSSAGNIHSTCPARTACPFECLSTSRLPIVLTTSPPWSCEPGPWTFGIWQSVGKPERKGKPSLELLLFYSKRLSALALPSFSRPIVGAQFTRLSFDSLTPCTIAFLPSGDALFD